MRRWGQYAIITFQILLIVSLVRGIQLSKRSSVRIAGLQETKEKLLSEQRVLQAEGEFVQSEYYLEKVAREELHLSKPGETVVIVPETSNQAVGIRNQEPSTKEEKANWQKWWEVLSGKI